MSKRWGFALAMGLVMVVSTAQFPLGLHDDGIEFPDGSKMTTATLGLGAAAQTGLNALCSGTIAAAFNGAACLPYTVPTGKILVMESVSVHIDQPREEIVRLVLASQDGVAGPLTVVHLLAHHLVGSNTAGNTERSGTTMLRAYFGAGEIVYFSAGKEVNLGGEVDFDFAFSGYLIDEM